MKDLIILLGNLIEEEEAQRESHHQAARDAAGDEEQVQTSKWYAYANYHAAQLLKEVLAKAATKLDTNK